MQICWGCKLTETDTGACFICVAEVAVVNLDDDNEDDEADEEFCNSPGHGRKKKLADLRLSD